MGAEVFDVAINIDGVKIGYATKVTAKKNKDTSTTLTFNGDVNTMSRNTGGTISVEGLYWPTNVASAIDLENMLNSTHITNITCSGVSYTASGDPYKKTIMGTDVIVTSDEDEWSPSDGITQKLEFAVNTLTRTAETTTISK